MAPLVYADQSAGALRLTLVEGEFDAEQFQVLDRARLLVAGVEIDAGIIGQSHFLAMCGENVRFTEIVACTPVEAARVHRFRRLPSVSGTLTTRPLGGIAGYRCRVHRRSMVAGRPIADALEAAALSAARSGRGIGLARRFPVGPEGAEARTVIYARPNAGRLEVRTVHAYPNEDASVFTHSIIRLV